MSMYLVLPLVLLLATIFAIAPSMLAREHKGTVRVISLGLVLTVLAAFFPAGSEWAITGNACDGWCYEKMAMAGFPMVVYRPDGMNSVSFFFSPLAFAVNFFFITCAVYAVTSVLTSARTRFRR